MAVRIKHKVALIALTVFSVTSLKAQYASEEELKKAANKFFNDENYNEALPLFSQLLSLYPKDPNYNFKYGASFLFAKRDKEDALRYLRFAASKPGVDPKAFYFLGVAEHHNYHFAEAEANYSKYKTKGNAKDISYYEVDRKITMTQNGRKLLKSMTDIGVLYKKEIKDTDFFRSYDLNGIGGKVVVKPDEFKTKLDLKKKENTLIHLGDRPNMIIFSSYGNDGKQGKDIYKVVKLPNGDWSKPAKFSDVINSDFDEDYPFLHPDGKTLYFSSKGFNSMGGYDVFKSTLNSGTGQWSYPENLDFPINTPDDDILFISDIDNELAFFASSRASKQGELTVYKVQVEAHPTATSIIKGMFLAESNPSMKNAKISVMDAEKDRTYGVFDTDDNGDYLLVFPGNGGNFKILVETTNEAPIHSAVIEIPAIDGFRALKQELRLVGEGDNEKLVVKNLFDESDEFDINDPLVVENLLKVKAKLDVNLTEEDLEKQAQETENETASLFENLSDEDLLANGIKKADLILEKNETAKKRTNLAYQIATEKGNEAKTVYAESEKLRNEGDEQGADVKKIEAANLVNESVAALNLAKVLESEANEIGSDVSKVEALKETISSNIANGNRSGAETAFAELNELSEASYIKESAIDNEKKINEDKITEKLAAYNKARNTVLEVANREVELETEISESEKQLALAKKKSEKEELQAKIDMAKIDLEDIKYELNSLKPKEVSTKADYEKVFNKTNVAKTVISKVEGTSEEEIITADIDKLSLDNNVVYFEQQGLVGLFEEKPIIADNASNSETTSNNSVNSESENTTENTESNFGNSSSSNDNSSLNEEVATNVGTASENTSIIDSNGEVKDYGTSYEEELTSVADVADPYQKNVQIAQINENWVKNIDEEIVFRENELSSTGDLNSKIQIESKVEALKSLREEKQKEANLKRTIAQTLNPDAFAENNTESSTNEVSVENGQESNNTNSAADILDGNGDVIDYNSDYSAQVKELQDNGDNEQLKEVYTEWNNAIEQDVLLKKASLVQAETEEEKNQIQNDINDLTAQLESNNSSITAIEDNQDNSVSSSDSYSELLNENGEVVDYNSDFETKITNADNIVETESSINEKKGLTEEWIAKIDDEIAYRNELIQNSNNEDDKLVQEGKINELNALKNEKQENLSELQLQLANASSGSTLADDNSSIDEALKSYDNVLSFEKSEEDKNLKVDYNPNLIYSSDQAQQEQKSVNTIKGEINAIYNQVDEKNEELLSIDDIAEREALIAETEELKNEAEEKEITLSRAYEKTNKSEYYHNQAVLSKAKESSSANSDNLVVAEMLEDEAVNFFDLAGAERQKANEPSSFSSKEQGLQKAYNYEIQALEKQNKAIQIYAEGKDLEELYNSTESEPLAFEENNNTTNSNTSVESEPNNTIEAVNVSEETGNSENLEEGSVADNSGEENETSTTNTELSSEQPLVSGNNVSLDNFEEVKANTNPVYQPVTVNLPSEETKLAARKLEREADILEVKAQQLTDSASVADNNNAKQELENEATELKEEAARKRKEAEVLYAQADENKTGEAELLDQLNEQRSEVSNETLTKEDQQMVANMSSDELNSITSSNEYVSYTEAQKEKRRLVKEAEVDYIEADKFQQEAEDEKTLGISLNALAAGAQGERKTKLLGQIEKLKDMIADNEENAAAARKRATDKEVLALEKSKEASDLINTSPNGQKMAAIEKTEAFNNEVLLAAKTSNTIVTETNTDNELANNSINAIESSSEEELNQSNNDENLGEEVISDAVEESTTNELDLTNELANSVEETINENDNNTVEAEELIDNTVEDNLTESSTNEIDNTVADESTNDTFESEIENNNSVENEVVEETNTNNTTASGAITSLNDNRLLDIPTVVNGPIFVFEANSTESPYNDANPIPSSESMPEGLVFKVQIGAFRNAIPQDHFKGFAPLMVEDAGNGISRYTAGFFKGINEAVEAKNSIRTIGYSDAFVVAFYNGERISIAEARTKMGEETPSLADNNTAGGNITDQGSSSSSNSSPNDSSNSTINSNEVNSSNANTESNSVESIPELAENYEEVNDGVSTDVHNIEGVFFTIQVGVYSKPVTSEQLSNVKPLNSERTESGLIRYTSGVYKTLDEANAAKDRVRTLGITDAFVIAYANGNRVKVSEAVAYSQANDYNTTSETISTSNADETSVPVENSASNNTDDSVNETQEPSATVGEISKEDQIRIGEELNLEFRIVLGEYADEVPIEDAAKFLKLSSEGIKNYQEGELSIYSVGAYPDYSSALDTQVRLTETEGFNNTKIVSFKDGNKITIEEALELVKNNL